MLDSGETVKESVTVVAPATRIATQATPAGASSIAAVAVPRSEDSEALPAECAEEHAPTTGRARGRSGRNERSAMRGMGISSMGGARVRVRGRRAARIEEGSGGR